MTAYNDIAPVVTADMVKMAIRRMESGTSAGNDGLRTEYVKYAREAFLKLLTTLFMISHEEWLSMQRH